MIKRITLGLVAGIVLSGQSLADQPSIKLAGTPELVVRA